MIRSHTKYSVHLDAETAQQLQQNVYNHRHHPGIERNHHSTNNNAPKDGSTQAEPSTAVVSLPAARIAAIAKALGEHPPKQVYADSLLLTRYLRARHPPAEAADIERKRHEFDRQLRDELAQKRGARAARRLEKQQQQNAANDDGSNAHENAAIAAALAAEPSAEDVKRIERRVQTLLAQRQYAWRPLDYDAYRSLQYLVGRTPAEYAVLVRILGELARRRAGDFAPHSFFDFGAGVGTGTWAAAHFWGASLFEYYAVDASRDMNDLADLLLRDGDENRPLQLRNVNYRQFLPASAEVSESTERESVLGIGENPGADI